uniref:glycine--tRNA ligase subunit beta n=1 Tax=Wolbachia endosymbiont of Pentidionis agamae TaxID=3110435 RepID=UPI002FD4E473
GPGTSVSQNVLEAFLNKVCKEKKDLFIKKVNGSDFYFVEEYNYLSNVKEILKSKLEEMLRTFPWPKSMRWGEVEEKWVRPIKSILCIFDDEVIPLYFARSTASRVTYGHRFFTKSKELIVYKIKDYFELLDKNQVILEQDKRKKFILDQIIEFTKLHRLKFENSDYSKYLLSKLACLLEKPIVLFGKINLEVCSHLPKEVITSIINIQQNYLAFSDENHNISHFATVVNVSNKKIIQGYEKTLESRLADAGFLISQDKKNNLDYYVNKLDSISFHAFLGSIGEKVKRIIALSKYIAIWIPYASLIKVERAAYLAKADLATLMVREFPELQGIIGGYYASYYNEDNEVIESIIEHYAPVNQNQMCPSSPTTVALSIADKIDNLVGLIAAGEKNSGSSDQFGLRRTAIGIIRVILENDLHIPIKLLIEKSLSLYPRLVSSKDSMLTNKINKKQVLEIVLKLCLERFKTILKKKNIRKDIIDAILCKDNINDLLTTEKQISILNHYLSTTEGSKIMVSYKRISNILNKAEKADKPTLSYNRRLLIENEEIALSDYLITANENIKQAIKNNHFNAALDELASFSSIVNQFMDSVKINCSSGELKKNRLSMIANVLSIFHLVANFGLIV